ncbi:MAG: hypothetical protein RIR51_770 [Bacteroidota bacterium]|jgi:Na+/H+-dicarboxylate symporter
MKSLPFHYKIIIGLVLGIIWAILSSLWGFSQFTTDFILPFGNIFISLLKMIAIPLVLFSVIGGVTGLSDVSSLGRIGLKTISIYIFTTILAVSLGIFLVNMFKPGQTGDIQQRKINRISYELWVSRNDNVDFLDDQFIMNKPENAILKQEALKKLSLDENSEFVKSSMNTAKSAQSKPLSWLEDMVPNNLFDSLTKGSMLQIIFFALFFGIAIVNLPRSKMQPLISFIDASTDIFIKMVDLLMKFAPFFVFALLAGKLAQMAGDDINNLITIFYALGNYSLVVILGLFIMILVVYPLLIIHSLSKKLNLSYLDSFKYYFKGIRPAQLLAFSTSSSAATLPLTMECVNQNLGVDEEISSFVLPIGATVNMDGTSLYQGVAVIFLAQFHMVDLSLSQQLTIVLTATLASIGTAAVPSAGLIMLIIVLESVGLNPAWIAIIFPVDRILDMIRTVVNVTGDTAVTVLVASSENKIKKID